MLLDTHHAANGSAATSQPLTEIEAAARLGLKVATLRAWRSQGRGPAYLRLGRAIRYLTTDINDFLQSHRQVPTATDRPLHSNEVSHGIQNSMAEDSRRG
ncbi:MAG: helix-turn-helix transcriptional regulator [Vicinamibacterales bacterium]